MQHIVASPSQAFETYRINGIDQPDFLFQAVSIFIPDLLDRFSGFSLFLTQGLRRWKPREVSSDWLSKEFQITLRTI